MDANDTSIAKEVCCFCGEKIVETEIRTHEEAHILHCSNRKDLTTLFNKAFMLKTDDDIVIEVQKVNQRSVSSDSISAAEIEKLLAIYSQDGLASEKPKDEQRIKARIETSTQTNDITYLIQAEGKTKDQRYQSQRLLCLLCNIEFDSIGEYSKHQFLIHQNRANSQIPPLQPLSQHTQQQAAQGLMQQHKFFCDQCNKPFTYKNAFEKHCQLHISSNRFQKQHTKKKLLSKVNVKPARSLADSVVQVSKDFEAAGAHSSGTVNIEKRFSYSQEMEFSPEVLRSAKQYIKSVSLKRKRKSLARLHNMNKKIKEFDGFGVDHELVETEESKPIVKDEGNRKAYICKVCNRKFYNRFHHREHFNIHSGETPYQCEFCNKKFAQRSGWNRHIKLHHKYYVFSGPINREHIVSYVNKSNTESMEKQERKSEGNDDSPIPIAIQNVQSVPRQPNTPGEQQMLSPGLPQPAAITTPDVNQQYTVIDVDTEMPIVTDTNVSPKQAQVTLMSQTFPPSSSVVQTQPVISPQVTHHLGQPTMVPTVIPVGLGIQNVTHLPIGMPNAIQVPAGYHFIPIPAPNGTIPSQIQPNHVIPIAPNNQVYTELPMNNKPSTENRGMDLQKSKTARVGSDCQFQCKKVQTISGDAVFTIRLTGNTEYAYILNSQGQIQSRIFVDESPKSSEWLDFPLDDTACRVLLKRVQDFDSMNKRGQKPHLINSKSPAATENYDFLDGSASMVDPERNDEGDADQGGAQGRKFRSGRIKKFSCPICSRKFLAQAHVNSHMLIHTGEFPYECIFCKRPFRHKSGLNSHHKRHFQKGIFNRPICGKGKYGGETSGDSVPDININPDQADVNTMQAQIQAQSKPKRKGRPPKHLKKLTEDSPSMANIQRPNIKEEEIILEGPESHLISSINGELENNTPIVLFECHFCSMQFTKKQAYMEHIENEHQTENDMVIEYNIDRNSPAVIDGNSLISTETLDTSSEETSDKLKKENLGEKGNQPNDVIKLEDFNEALIAGEGNLSTNIKIKDEIIDN